MNLNLKIKLTAILTLACNFILLTAIDNVEVVLSLWENKTNKKVTILQILGSTKPFISTPQLLENDFQAKFIAEIAPHGKMRSAENKLILEKSPYYASELQKTVLLIVDESTGEHILLEIVLGANAVWAKLMSSNFRTIDEESIDVECIKENENIGIYIQATISGNNFQRTKIDELNAFTGKIEHAPYVSPFNKPTKYTSYASPY